MPSKKKSKPSFQVPEELQTAPQAGWVYRSEEEAPAKVVKPVRKSPAGSKATPKRKHAVIKAPVPASAASAAPVPMPLKPKLKPAAPPPKKNDRSSKSSLGVMDLTARTLSAGIGTAGNIILMTTRIMTAPLMIGKRFLGL